MATNNTERMRIDSSGNVGIGTSSVAGGRVQISGATSDTNGLGLDQGQLLITDSDAAAANGMMLGYRFQAGITEYGRIQCRNAIGATNLILQAGGGNVGIGTSSPVSTLDVVGQEIRIQAPTFPKVIWNSSTNGTNVKKWQAYVDTGGTFKIAALNDAENAELGTYQLDRTFFAFGVDNTASVGTASVRWSVIYAATGTINTSDEREKEWRSGLTEGELRASKRIVAELGFYRWVDAVAKKGDEARYHFGARAQQVWAIMADEGLVDPIIDGLPGNAPYAFLCFDQWDAVPEVPAVKEVLEENGEVVEDAQAAIPAKPAGNRFGLRVDQLTMFLIAAQEQRLAALEALP
jgi:hypothetical protein